MALKLPNGRFRVQIRIKGHPTIDRVFDSASEARAFEDAERHRIVNNVPLWSLSMTFAEAWKAYQGSLLFNSKRDSTRRTELSRIQRGLDELGPYTLAQLQDGQILARFRDGLVHEPQKARGVNLATPSARARVKRALDGKAPKLAGDSQRLVLAAVSAVLLWAVDTKLYVRNPLLGIRKPPAAKRTRRMQRDEELNVFLVAKSARHAGTQLAEDARFVAIQRELGCRPGELAKLMRSDLDLEASAVRFPDTKNRETRIVHVVAQARELLAAQLVHAEVEHPDSPYVFTSRARQGGLPVPYCYSSAIKRLRKKGIVANDFHAHAVRREFASASFEAGLPVEDIRKATGHKSIKALEAYNVSDALHPEARKRVEAAAALRQKERFEDLAASFGLSAAELTAAVKDARGQSVQLVGREPRVVSHNPQRGPLRGSVTRAEPTD